MKKYKQLKTTSVRPYESKDFKELFVIFLKFQKEAKIGTYHNICKGHGDTFVVAYLIEELKTLLKRCKHNYVAIDEDTGKIWGFGCGTNDIMNGFMDVKNSIEIQIVFKDPDYIFNRIMKQALLVNLKRVANGRRVFAALGPRDKFMKYLGFVKKMFNLKIHGKDTFGKVWVEFL